jgi:hypothetical protein
VFGLRMPNGMSPTGNPSPGVYRFEGSYEPALVTRFIEEQLLPFAPPTAEPRSALYRRVEVKTPAAGAERAPLAIRVHTRDKGSAVDVWLEAPVAGPSAASAAPPAELGSPSFGASMDGQAKPAYETPAERRRAVFEMMQKVNRGEPLTPQDMDNPLFQ